MAGIALHFSAIAPESPLISMARLPRYNLRGIPQHVILRGNNRSAIFAAEGDSYFF